MTERPNIRRMHTAEKSDELLFDPKIISEKDWERFSRFIEICRNDKVYSDLVKVAGAMRLLKPDKQLPVQANDVVEAHDESMGDLKRDQVGRFIEITSALKILQPQRAVILDSAQKEKIRAVIQDKHDRKRWALAFAYSVEAKIIDPESDWRLPDEALENIITSRTFWQNQETLASDVRVAAGMRILHPEVDMNPPQEVWRSIHVALRKYVETSEDRNLFLAVLFAQNAMILSAEKIQITRENGLELSGHKRHVLDEKSSRIPPESLSI